MMTSYNKRLLDLNEKVEKLEKTLQFYEKEDRETLFNLVDQCASVIKLTNERVDQIYKDIHEISDRLNLAEGMIDILKKNVEELREIFYKEELDGCKTSE